MPSHRFVATQALSHPDTVFAHLASTALSVRRHRFSRYPRISRSMSVCKPSGLMMRTLGSQ